MTDITKYANNQALAALCIDIDMPEEVTAIIKEYADTIDFKEYQQSIIQLLNKDTSESAAKTISERCNKEKNGIKELTIHLAASLYTKERYLQKQIEHQVFIDTMKIFSRFVRENMSRYGYYGFDRGWWTYRVLNSSLFRLSQLEFEIVSLKKDVDYNNCKIGDPVISIHIPSDAKISNDETLHSFTMAREFFRTYFSEIEYKFIFCYSWLLSPALRDLLSPKSNILAFQDNFKLIYAEGDDNNFMEWVYKKIYEDYSELPEDTTLQRNIKQHLQNGGKIGSGYGILTP